MDDKQTADILAVCNTLGYSDGINYYPDPQCLDSAKALVLYLRRDTDEHEVRRLLGEAQVLQRDLIPIHKLKECNDDLFEVVLRLMVNLTNHALLVYEEELPKNKKYRNHYITINRHLQGYKTTFLDDAFWRVICTRLKKLIQDMDVLLENQKLTVERILIMIRNVLQIPADPEQEMRNDDDASIHDQVLWVMYTSGIQDLLLFIASSDTTREFCMHVLEIIALFFREQTGEQLARTSLERSLSEKTKDAAELAQCLHSESLIKAKKQVSGRSFGGTFVVQGVDGPSGRNLICHKPVNSVSALSLDSTKKTKKTPTNRRQIVEPTNTRRSTLSIRLMLKEFCVDFLNGAYNNLMRVVKDHLIRSKGQEHDETYYLFAIRFFMEFNRCLNFNVSLVSETMNTSTFHYVQGLIDHFHGLMTTEKEKITLWSKRGHAALRAYQELLGSLYVMEKVPESMEASRGIQATLFYLPEYRELCVGLLGSYEGAKWSRNYLCDLVDTNHLFLRMLEATTKEKRILVKGTKRTRIGTKSKKSRKSTKRLKKNSEDEWNCLENELREFLLSDYEEEMAIPFDAASDTPDDEQKVTALTRIATHVAKKEFNKAISLHRAAREVWPSDDQLSMENEISSLKSIFLAASPQLDDDPGQGQGTSEEENEEQDEIDEEEDDELQDVSRESDFDFRGFMEKYTTPKIVSNLANLFKQFTVLTPLTLHAILKMFHRYVFDMGYPALLCQASVFQTFQNIIKISHVREDYKDARKFFNHFWAKFVKMAESNPKIFLEILFWKTGREAQEIQEGYTQYKPSQTRPKFGTGVRRIKASAVRKTLSEEEENEIMVLAEEYAALQEKTMKQVDWINDKLINGPKVKKVISAFLEEKGLLISSTKQRRKSKPKIPWSDADIESLKVAYEEFKHLKSVIRQILEKLSVKRTRNAVVNQLIELNLIRDKSDLPSAKNRGAGKGKTIGMDFLRENGVSFGTRSGSDSGSGSSSDDEDKTSESEDEKNESGEGILKEKANSGSGSGSDVGIGKKNRSRISAMSDSDSDASIGRKKTANSDSGSSVGNKKQSRILANSDSDSDGSVGAKEKNGVSAKADSDSDLDASIGKKNTNRIPINSGSDSDATIGNKKQKQGGRILANSDSDSDGSVGKKSGKKNGSVDRLSSDSVDNSTKAKPDALVPRRELDSDNSDGEDGPVMYKRGKRKTMIESDSD